MARMPKRPVLDRKSVHPHQTATILIFPQPPRDHGRTSAGCRAARLISNSAVMPAERAGPVSTTFDHQSDGILSRCHHLLTVREPAPTSAARASLEAHNSMTERNEAISRMDILIRPFVLNGKSMVSSDFASGDGCNVLMGKTEFKQQFMKRVTQAREARGLNQEQMATLLGIKQSKYHKYESRSYMPHDLVPMFCLAAGVEEHWLFTGRRRQADQTQPPAAATKPPKRSRGRKTA